MVMGHHGIMAPGIRPDYKAYRSPYGPKYTIGTNIRGVNITRASKFATTAALFGGVAGFAALFFFAEVPKVRTDIMMKIPVIGDYFVKDIAPEDNPF